MILIHALVYSSYPLSFWLNLLLFACIQLLTGITCSREGRCSTGQFISESLYNQVSAYTMSLQALFDALPGMESLADCEPVYRAVNEIRWKHCKPVKKYIRTVWAAMVTLSILMMFLIFIWMAKDYYDRRRHISDGSVNPHLSTPDMSDTDTNVVKDKKPLDVQILNDDLHESSLQMSKSPSLANIGIVLHATKKKKKEEHLMQVYIGAV